MIVRLDRVTYRVDGVDLVSGVDLEVGRGEVVAVVGPNGAGKTTLVSLMAGDLEPVEGTVTVAGRPAADVAALSLERAVLPQHHLLTFAFRCLEVVLMGRHPHPTGEEEDRAVAERAMVETDTGSLRDRAFPTLSGGEQTRVSLARVLAQETPLIVLDEPTSSLDLRHQELVMTTLRGLAAAGGTVVTVLHDLDLAARHADRIVLMDRGRIHAVGTPGDVFREAELAEVYGCPVRVFADPVSGTPIIRPSVGGTAG